MDKRSKKQPGGRIGVPARKQHTNARKRNEHAAKAGKLDAGADCCSQPGGGGVFENESKVETNTKSHKGIEGKF